MLSTSSFFERMQQLANNIRRDVEKQLNRSFKKFDVIEHEALNDKDSAYYMKIKTDDNGHVRVKTMEKAPGSNEWKTQVEEYDRGQRALGQQERKALGESGQEKMSIESQGKSETTSTQAQTKPETTSTQAQGKGEELSKQETQELANSFRKDIERQLDRTFRTFDVLERNFFDEAGRRGLNMRIRTDDDDWLGLRAIEKWPGGDWLSEIDEIFTGRRTEGSYFNRMQKIASKIQKDVEKQLNRSFKRFDVLEEEARKDPEHSAYYMKILTDDNGHVKVKTVEKPPGSNEWETKVEEYDKGKALGQGEGQKPLEQGQTRTAESRRTEISDETRNLSKEQTAGGQAGPST